MRTNGDHWDSILGYLFHHGPVTRIDLADALGIRPNTVGKVCADLLKTGAIQEVVPNRQRNVPLSIHPDFLYAVGAGYTEAGFRVVLMDASGATRAETMVPVNDVAGRRRCEVLGDGISVLLGKSKVPRSRVIGIGFADNGIIDDERGVAVRAVHIPGWSDIPVREILKERTGLHTHLLNYIASVAVLALRKIAEPGWDTALCVWVDSGIGLSVFLNGEPLRGNHPVFGEIGHIVVEPDGSMCWCGNRGCLETVSSTGAVLQRIAQGVARGVQIQNTNHEISTIDEVIADACHGEKLARRVLYEAGRAVGRVLAMVVNILGVSNVLLLGKLTEAGDIFLDPVKRAVGHNCIAPLNADVCFHTGGSLQERAAEGAGYFVFHDYFTCRSRPKK